MQLSKNFSLKELTASQTADRHGISNNPSEDHMDNLKKLKRLCCRFYIIFQSLTNLIYIGQTDRRSLRHR